MNVSCDRHGLLFKYNNDLELKTSASDSGYAREGLYRIWEAAMSC